MAIRLERSADRPHVALVVIDRPAKANSLDPPTLLALADAWRTLAADDDVRAVVLTGAGDRVFCGGMDMTTTIPASQRLARGERLDAATFEGLRAIGTAMLTEFQLGKPIVAAVNGHARAVGCDLLLATDVRYAAPHATFALEEVARGLYPTGHATVLLPRQIPWVHAQALLLTAEPIDAARAAAVGLVNEVVEPAALLGRALDTAARIAANAPLAVQATWRGVRELAGRPLGEAYHRQEELGRPLRRTEDAREAQRAFVEQRPPRWSGR